MAEFKDHFSTRAADYAAYRPSYPLELANYLAGLPARRELALDCGCGAGQLSALLGDLFDRVIATDASAEQVAHATLHARVDYRCAPAERSGLEGVSVDLLTVAQAAHWFDLDAFYAEARRVLRPDGAIVLITYGVTVTDGRPGEILSHFYRDVIGRFWPAERRHVETQYRDLPFPFREETAPPLAMQAAWPLARLLGYVDTWSAVRNAEKTLGRAPYEAFCAEMREAWGEPETAREIRWPLRSCCAISPRACQT
jgi:SAM-dependent methyltransferase